MQFSEYQNKIFDFLKEGKGNLVVKARAGSGKTTTLVEIAKRAKGKILVLAFNKEISINLKERLVKNWNIDVKTHHALGKSILYRNSLYGELDEEKIKQIVLEDGCEEEGAVCKLVRYAKDYGIGVICKQNEGWNFLLENFDINPDSEKDCIDAAKRVLKKSNENYDTIDFSDMVYLPFVRKCKFPKYDLILVDEAQDCSELRRLLAKKCLKKNGRAVFVGDEFQSIFGFAMANQDAMDRIVEDFNATVLPLPISYRCPLSVIEEAQKIVPDIEARPGAEEGIVQTVYSDKFRRDIEELGLNCNDVFLSRFNFSIFSMVSNLLSKGIPCKVIGRDICSDFLHYIGKWKRINDVTGLIEKLEEHKDREVEKLTSIGRNLASQSISDKINSLIVLLERCNFLGLDLQESREYIKKLFDENDGKNIVQFSTIHRFKGREADRVFWLYPDHELRSSRVGSIQEESNLKYVATTRTKKELVYIYARGNGPEDENLEPEEKDLELEADRLLEQQFSKINIYS